MQIDQNPQVALTGNWKVSLDLQRLLDQSFLDRMTSSSQPGKGSLELHLLFWKSKAPTRLGIICIDRYSVCGGGQGELRQLHETV